MLGIRCRIRASRRPAVLTVKCGVFCLGEVWRTRGCWSAGPEGEWSSCLSTRLHRFLLTSVFTCTAPSFHVFPALSRLLCRFTFHLVLLLPGFQTAPADNVKMTANSNSLPYDGSRIKPHQSVQITRFWCVTQNQNEAGMNNNRTKHSWWLSVSAECI